MLGDAVADVRSAAHLYISLGWQVVPLAPKSKACVNEGWLRLIFKPSDFRADDNIGIRSVGGLVDIDCDAAEVVAMAPDFLPHTNAIYGRPNKPNAHWLYSTTLEKIIVYRDLCVGSEKDKSTLIELRVNHQSMAPPSIHPDGQALEWNATIKLEATAVDIDVLHHAVRLLATAAVMGRYYNPPGNRHEWGLALAGLLRQVGLTEEECAKVFTAAGKWARDPELGDRLGAVRSSYGRADDDPVKAGAALKELMPKVGKTFVETIYKIWGSSSNAFIADHDRVAANNQENIRRALDKLECKLAFDEFSQRTLVDWRDHHSSLDDPIRNRLWLEIDRTFRFRPTPEFFDIVLQDIAWQNRFHPVRDYLEALKWDGKPRVDTWLIDSGRAADTEYVRAVSALVLIAAVRRVRRPGCKFDELMVLESEQGLLKSTALRTLCPREDWFSDDLPLNVDAKQLIESTLGKWFIEAADLSGMAKSQVEHLKAMLSRQVDGPVRMAYARMPIERPRQFVIVGTTNAHAYLKDTTGNRRFWPVRVEKFNIKYLQDNRDQIWAEVALRERRGESNRLAPSLYAMAAMQQERRRAEDPWEDRLGRAYDDETKQYRVAYDAVWELVNVPVGMRDDKGHERICAIMQRLGFRRMSVRDENKKVCKGWGRDPLGPMQGKLEDKKE